MWPASWNTTVTPGASCRSGSEYSTGLNSGMALRASSWSYRGLEPAPARPPGLAGAPLRLHLLDVGRVEQHDLGQVAGGGGGVDGPGIALLHQPREPARVVDVGVGEQDERDLRGVEGEGREVERLLLLAPLMHAAIHQEAGLPDLHDVAWTR